MSQSRESSGRSRFLGAELRKRRENADLSALHLAQRIGWAPSTVSRIESGERGATPVNLATYLTLCDVLREEQAALVELARAREDERWVCPHGDLLPDESPALRFQQEQANRITCYHPGAIPELLQTSEVAALQLAHQTGMDLVLADRLRDRVAARLARQQILHQTGKRSWMFYLDEVTLRTVPGDHSVRSGQLVHLAMLIGQHQVRIRVLPAKLAQSNVAMGRFWLFGFAAYAPVVCTQTDTISLFAEREPDLVAYLRILDRLNALALPERDSRELIVRLADDQPTDRDDVNERAS